VDSRRLGGPEPDLGEDDHDQIASRIDQPRGAEAAVPAERSCKRTLCDDRLAEAPAQAVEEGLEPALCSGVSWSRVISATRPAD
jgi:hypothetical protein